MFEYEENRKCDSSINIYNLDDSIKEDELSEKRNIYIHIPIPEGKKGRKPMLIALQKIVPLLNLLHWPGNGKKLLVHCQQGKDRSVCMALFLKLFYERRQTVGKDEIRNELFLLQQKRYQANPSRFHLQTLSEMFCSWK
jgi:hypothetical protein